MMSVIAQLSAYLRICKFKCPDFFHNEYGRDLSLQCPIIIMNSKFNTQRRIVLRAFLISSVMLTLVPQAFAQEMTCPMTLDTLPMCITHHWELGEIMNYGVYISLLAKANAAIATQSQGQIKTTINILNAFINQVSALAGRQIADAAASHMIMHAQAIIRTLQ